MAISEDRTTLPEINPLPPSRPRRRPSKRSMAIPKRGYRAPVSSLLSEMRGPLPPEERRLLRTIARNADTVAQGSGRVFLLLELSPRDVDRLAAFEAGGEDLDYAYDQPVPPDQADFVFDFASLNTPTVLNEERGGEHTIVSCAPQTASQGGFLQESELRPNVFTPADAPAADSNGRGMVLLPPVKYDINGQPVGIWNGFRAERRAAS